MICTCCKEDLPESEFRLKDGKRITQPCKKCESYDNSLKAKPAGRTRAQCWTVAGGASRWERLYRREGRGGYEKPQEAITADTLPDELPE